MNQRLLKASLLTLGASAGVLGAYGSFQYAMSLDGGFSYLALTAPLVAIVAAVLPYAAERAWSAGDRVKSLVCWLLLIPCVVVVFGNTVERVHFAKASAAAERTALRDATVLARDALATAERKADAAERDVRAARAKSRHACDARCLSRWEAEAVAARSRVVEARTAVTAAEAKATAESTISAPVWLLPACNDAVAAVFVWLGLAIPATSKRKAPAKRKAKRKPVAKPAIRVVK
jgi:hypothetical protein